jgi:hypothetical protein
MLDIAFYTEVDKSESIDLSSDTYEFLANKSESIDLSSDTYEFLANAGFGKISKEQQTIIVLGHEEVLEIDVVNLSTKRKEYSSCIRKAIAHLCFSIVTELKDVELENIFGCIKKLKELLLQIENENNKFMEF